MTMELKRITISPFKSLKSIDVAEWEVDPHGLKYDRIYMLLHKTPSGEWQPMTQRNEASMSRIVQKLQGDNLVLTYEGGSSIELPLDITKLESTGPNIQTELWGEKLNCRDISTPAMQEFFQTFFAKDKYSPANLAVVVSEERRIPPHHREHTKKHMSQANVITTSFQDMWPCTLMTTASFEDLQTHVSMLDESTTIKDDSFRMNLLVDTDEPWIEDTYLSLRIGGHDFVVDSPTERCPIPSIDQETGEYRKSRHPRPSLNRFRILEKGKTPCFGLNMINKDSGYKLKLGDKVEVLEQSDY